MHPYLVDRLPWIGTSSLIQVAWLQNSFFPGAKSAGSVGVVTFKKSSLVSKGVLMGSNHGLTADEEAPRERGSSPRYPGVRASRGRGRDFQSCPGRADTM
jgi:hypothetical protein